MPSLAFAAAAAAVALAGTSSTAAPLPTSDEAAPSARAVSWRCDGDSCAGGGPNAPSDAALIRECEQVVSVIGPVSRYQSRGRELSAAGLAHCNRRATRTPIGR